MKQIGCPEGERVLAGIASDDPMVVLHTANCGRCRRLLEETAGIMGLLVDQPDLLDDAEDEVVGATRLRVTAAMLLLCVLSFAVGRIQPVNDAAGNGLRGRLTSQTLVARAVRIGDGWTFNVDSVPAVDEFTVEIWGVESNEPLQVSSPEVPLAVSAARIERTVGSGPTFWLVRASIGGVEVAASTPRPLGQRGDGDR